MGATEKHTLVRGPVIRPAPCQAPRTFEVSALVANNLEGDDAKLPVRFALATSGGLSVTGPREQPLEVAPGRDAAVRFRVRALPDLGAATLVWSAQAGERRVRSTLELSVRPGVAKRTSVASGVVDGGGSQELPKPRAMFGAQRDAQVFVSAAPLALARGLVAYLDDYPHPCSEQLVSNAGPCRPGADLIPEPMRDRCDTAAYFPQDAELLPATWVRTLAAAAADRGATLFEHSPVTGLERRGDGCVVHAGSGTVQAQAVVVACDGLIPRLLPQLDGILYPVRGQVLATEPLHPGPLAYPTHSQSGFMYYRPTDDGRVVVGGGRLEQLEHEYTDQETVTAGVQARLDAFLAEWLGLGGARVTHRWAGIMGFSADLLPVVGGCRTAQACTWRRRLRRRRERARPPLRRHRRRPDRDRHAPAGVGARRRPLRPHLTGRAARKTAQP